MGQAPACRPYTQRMHGQVIAGCTIVFINENGPKEVRQPAPDHRDRLLRGAVELGGMEPDKTKEPRLKDTTPMPTLPASETAQNRRQSYPDYSKHLRSHEDMHVFCTNFDGRLRQLQHNYNMAQDDLINLNYLAQQTQTQALAAGSAGHL